MKKVTVRWMIQVAILSALAAVVMVGEFAIPFIGPSFLKMDFAEIVVLIGAFSLGPVAGVVIEIFKVLLNLLLDGTWSVGIGEFANFLIGTAFVLPASIIYFRHKTKKQAIIGLAVGVVMMAIASALLNLFVLLPMYAGFMGLTIEQLIMQYSLALPYVTNVSTGILLGIIPFNLFKGTLVSIIVILLYKRVSPLLKSHDTDATDETKEE
ncbi:MAG: ECF transporter S component [Candidatus Izemoplasmatales bacterium]|jgi:riboflavin transporter FmnP